MTNKVVVGFSAQACGVDRLFALGATVFTLKSIQGIYFESRKIAAWWNVVSHGCPAEVLCF